MPKPEKPPTKQPAKPSVRPMQIMAAEWLAEATAHLDRASGRFKKSTTTNHTVR